MNNFPKPVFSIADSEATSHIVMNGGGTEMLKITKDSFYVRGVKVPQDEKEAQEVYEAFRQWMTYMALTNKY